MSAPAFGFRTKKTPTGFDWSVTQTVWDVPTHKAITTVLKSGSNLKTRDIATTQAKKWLLFFRRGGKLPA